MSPLALLVLPAVLGAGPGPAIVEVELLAGSASRVVSLVGPEGRHDVAVHDGRLVLDGRNAGETLHFPRGDWRVKAPAAAERAFSGELELRADPRRVRIVAYVDLEDYVGWTVASETAPGTHREALRAQAVVARSYALAGGRRHPDVDFCDLAHCQVLRGGLRQGHREAGRRAAMATRGEVLQLPSGRTAQAPFHAACGGHTGAPGEVFGGEGTGAGSVPDDGCEARPWRASIPAETFEAVVAERLGGPATPEALEWRIGRGGYVVQVALGNAVTGGEAFARALDARFGHRWVRSARFVARSTPGGVLLEGTGLGHGVGLCQAGAARRAKAGAGYREILAHYFREARMVRGR